MSGSLSKQTHALALFLRDSFCQRREMANELRFAIYPGAKPLNRPKVLICGPAGVGKTSLVYSLQYGSFEKAMASLVSAAPAHDPASTPVHITNGTISGGGGEFSFWDLQGMVLSTSCSGRWVFALSVA